MTRGPKKPCGGRTIGVVGRNIRRLRGDLSQAELALRAGLSRGAIADLERGHSQSPDAETQRKLARALGVESADLWREPGQQEVQETRPGAKAVENLPGGLAGFIEAHQDELGPREKERLMRVAQSMSEGAPADARVWEYHLSAIRRQLALEDGVL